MSGVAATSSDPHQLKKTIVMNLLNLIKTEKPSFHESSEIQRCVVRPKKWAISLAIRNRQLSRRVTQKTITGNLYWIWTDPIHSSQKFGFSLWN